ncbi:Legume-like lectin family protein [Trichomonas vaginalis G3]|uniref:Legume-like lectin family protein n=1 Tax=Trichomonas vaginalis (strain ATCC PRA-98 / G3) TaxID=412133 RepID=A2DWG3_TRIV3|nr:lectin leg-like domain-containing protein [Trichomonas vaginalis G3]EAY15303.1 Legume-like lectin family protein [Trichomonas vaginalis G3]KAI5536601.1 lectin leg-like domain-containing protein [Trichomonas vaginalis G3]|eukprot:XP_001327526.1 Legume-like lectin family protein [Trichomonas vaginalis G3]
MLPFFTYLSMQEPQPAYNLVPPFEATDVNTIGNWTTRGTALILKNAIRLTSDIPSSFGSICQRVPTLFKEWTAEVEIKATSSSEDKGTGLWFFYTEEVCPDRANVYNGFAVWVNTTTDENGNNGVYFKKGNGTEFNPYQLKPVGVVKALSNTSAPMRLMISRRFDQLTIDATKDIILERILDVDVTEIPDYGYFSFSAQTSAVRSMQHDLLSMRVHSMSDCDHPNATFDYSSKNKKYIEDMVEIRRIHKRNRRANMPVSNQYNKLSKELNRLLDENPNSQIKDAISIIDEAASRMKSAETPQALGQFIIEKVNETIQQAVRKIEVAKSKYDETETDLDELWSSLKKQLLELAVETKISLENLEKEVLEAAKNLNLSTSNPIELKKSLKHEVEIVNEQHGFNILLFISVIEITAYVIFFLYKRHETHNFKKYD